MRIGDFVTHPVADAFPLMEGDPYEELLEDIEENGQREPIIVIRRKNADVVVDGRNRLRACLELGLEPLVTSYRGKRDMLTLARLVTSLNLRRRHIVPAKRAIIYVRLEDLVVAEKEKAAARQRSGKRVDDEEEDLEANLPQGERGRVREVLAEMAGVSPRSMQAGLNIERRGVPELADAVLNEGVALSTADEISKLDDDEQREVLEQAKGAPRSIRRILKEREATRRAADATPPGAITGAAQDPPAAFTAGVNELKAHLRRARGACAALVQATPWPDGLGPEARTAETDALIAAIDQVIAKAGRLGSGPDLRLIHGGAGDAE